MKRSATASPTPTECTHEPTELETAPIPPPFQKKSKPNRSGAQSSQKATTSTITSGPGTVKGQFLMYIFKRGMKGLDKAEVEKLMGFKASQQKELLRMDGKGALYNQVVKAAGQL